MSYYKLKKSLPTFEEGDIFELDKDGSLYLLYSMHKNGEFKLGHWKDRVMAYHNKTLKRFPNILRDWFEEIEIVILPAYMKELLQKWVTINGIKTICCVKRDIMWTFYGRDAIDDESYSIDIIGNFDLEVETYHYYSITEMGLK